MERSSAAQCSSCRFGCLLVRSAAMQQATTAATLTAASDGTDRHRIGGMDSTEGRSAEPATGLSELEAPFSLILILILTPLRHTNAGVHVNPAQSHCRSASVTH